MPSILVAYCYHQHDQIFFKLIFTVHLCVTVAISYIQTSTVIEFISCTDGPQATGLSSVLEVLTYIYIYI